MTTAIKRGNHSRILQYQQDQIEQLERQIRSLRNSNNALKRNRQHFQDAVKTSTNHAIRHALLRAIGREERAYNRRLARFSGIRMSTPMLTKWETRALAYYEIGRELGVLAEQDKPKWGLLDVD